MHLPVTTPTLLDLANSVAETETQELIKSLIEISKNLASDPLPNPLLSAVMRS